MVEGCERKSSEVGTQVRFPGSRPAIGSLHARDELLHIANLVRVDLLSNHRELHNRGGRGNGVLDRLVEDRQEMRD